MGVEQIPLISELEILPQRPLENTMCLVLTHLHLHHRLGVGARQGGGPGHTAGETPAWGSGSVSGALVLQVLFEEVGGTSCGKCLLQIQDIVRRRQLLTVFREGKDGQQDVDVAILQALLKGEGQAR